MVSSIGSSSSEVGRNLLLEMLANSSKIKVSESSTTSTDETSTSTTTQKVSFEDLIGLLSSSKSGSEMAPPPPPHEEQGALPSDVDIDGDGTLSTDEYDLMISDIGINGALSSTDFFSQYDVNNDGEITSEEMPEPGSLAPAMTSETSETSDLVSELFSQYDTNQDGAISADEFTDMIASLQENTSTEDSMDSKLLLQRIAMDAIRAYEENYGYAVSTAATSSLNNMA